MFGEHWTDVGAVLLAVGGEAGRIMEFGEQWGYLGIFLILLSCSLGLPLPEDLPILTGGWLVHRELARIWLMIPVAMAGVLAGDCILYYVGKRFGNHVVELPLFRRIVKPARLLMAEQLFQKHGVKIIFIGRFLPGLRPMIFMAAGVLRVPFKTFIGVNGLAACVSVPTLVFLGKIGGDHLEQVSRDVRKATSIVVLAVILIGLALAGVYLHRRQTRMMEAAGVNAPIDPETLAHMPPQAEPLAGDPPPDENSSNSGSASDLPSPRSE